MSIVLVEFNDIQVIRFTGSVAQGVNGPAMFEITNTVSSEFVRMNARQFIEFIDWLTRTGAYSILYGPGIDD